jgi:hypothetical protein
MCSVHGEDADCLKCAICGGYCVCEYGGCQNRNKKGSNL